MAQNLREYPPKKMQTGWWVAFLAGGLIILCLMGFALVGALRGC
jgi:ABC-type dipeptide/oligopeptide/nickel transport system permease subunit